MNALERPLEQKQPRSRILYAFCTTIALLSIFPTLFLAAKFYQYQGVLLMAFSVITLLLGHLSRLLSRYALRPTETSGRFFASVALCVGYGCFLVGLLSQLFG